MCNDAGHDWDQHFLAGLFRDQEDIEEPEGQDDDSYDLEPLSPKIKEAVSAIKDIQAFLDFKGHNELGNSLTMCTHLCTNN